MMKIKNEKLEIEWVEGYNLIMLSGEVEEIRNYLSTCYPEYMPALLQRLKGIKKDTSIFMSFTDPHMGKPTLKISSD
ncbi:hypothetical protein LJB83_01625 [Clostridia bacterium OttesenSCG-928-F22]|nr:hypothetical protein [Clostridia bacterium OttesenSCG-928-F22]